MFQLNRQRKAFLDMLAVSEIGQQLLSRSDNGYNVMYTGKLFRGYAAHPNIVNCAPIKGRQVCSTAAGRYQLLYRYWKPYMALLKLSRFDPTAQDQVALQQIKEQGALADIDAGRLSAAVQKCANIWASLPGAGYNQHENSMVKLRLAFLNAGGTFNS